MGIIYTGDKFKHSRMQLEFTNIMGKRRITELEKECENLRNCLHHVLEENKRGRHILGEPELKSSMAKRDLMQQAKGVDEAVEFFSPARDLDVEALQDYAENLRKQADEL